MPGGRYPWAMRAGGPLLGGGGALPVLFGWNPELAETLPATSTFTRASIAQVLTTTDDTTNWYQEAKSGEVRLDGERRVEQLLTNADWTGGTLPTGWTAPLGTGTRTVVSTGLSGPGSTGIRFQATNERPFIRQSSIAAVNVGDIIVAAVFIEATPDIGSATTGMINFNGSTASITLSLTPITPNAVAGQWLMARGTVTAAGNLGVSIGPGASGNEPDADITISSPIVARVQDSSDVFGAWASDIIEYLNIGVNGVQYFNTTNGNSVDGNGVVTEATGTTITGGGYLPEPAATNLEPNSTPLDANGWTLDECTEIDLGVTDIGFKTTTITATANNVDHRIFGTSIATTGAHTASVIARDAGGQFIVIRVDASSGNNYAVFDLINGTITEEDAGLTDALIEDLGNGWYRCSVIRTITSNARPIIHLSDTGTPGIGNPSFAGTGEAIDIAHVQPEATAFPTSPILTSGSTVTRVADSLTDVDWPVNSSAVVDVTVDNPIALPALGMTMLGFGSGAGRIFAVDAPQVLRLFNAGINSFTVAATSYEGERHSYGMSLALNQGIVVDDESNNNTDVTGTPGQGTIYIGSDSVLAGQPCKIHRVRIYAFTQTIAELEALF